MKRPILLCLLPLMLLAGCRKDELVLPIEYEYHPNMFTDNSAYSGLYMLNEGNMGSNKCSLDYLDYENGYYARNIYPERNPHVLKELGDVGNDIQIYGSKLYAVINCSNKVEVMDAHSAIRLGQIEIPNGRSLAFYRGNAYISSYVSGVKIDSNAPLGMVYRVDTTTLKITGTCTVGYQPEQMAVLGEYLYVANSGGYRVPNYDYTVSVIELERFKQIEKIPVGLNLNKIKADHSGRLWVTSRGNYEEVDANLYVLEKKKGSNRMVVADTLNIPCSDFFIHGDSLYYFATLWNNHTQTNHISYGIIHTTTKQKVCDHFIQDGTEAEIKIPYGLLVHPETGDIYVCDAKNYVSSGMLYCYSSEGKRKWSAVTGDIPGHMVLLKKEKR